MKNELFHHPYAYTILTLGLIVHGGFFYLAWPQRSYQQLAIISLVVFYLLWGVITHTKSAHINSKVILEYASISLLAGVVLLLLTF